MTEKYICTNCSFIYDPEAGDPEHGIAPGTPFSELPEDWECPDCGVAKRYYQPLNKYQ